MKIKEISTGEIYEASPYNLDGRLVAYRSYSKLVPSRKISFTLDEVEPLPKSDPKEDTVASLAEPQALDYLKLHYPGPLHSSVEMVDMYLKGALWGYKNYNTIVEKVS